MATILTETDRRCNICRTKLLAAPVPAEGAMWRKSVPVFVCPRCDFNPTPESARMWASHARYETGKL
jgi:hypothetical protein